MRPLLVHHGWRIAKYAVIEIGTEPGHGKSGRSTGTDTHGRAAIRVLRQHHMRILFDARQHLLLDPFSIGAGHRVIFAAPFGALRVLSACAYADGYHRWQLVRADQIVQHVEELLRLEKAMRAAIAVHDEGCCRTGDIIGWDIDVDFATPTARMARGHQKIRFVAGRSRSRIHRRVPASGQIVTNHAGPVDNAVCRVHGEGMDRAVGHIGLGNDLWRRLMRRADNEVAVAIDRWNLTIR